jgi:hypothetical protein
MLIPMVEMLQKEMQSLRNFSFLKIVKIEPSNKVQSFFQKEMPSVPVKQHGTIFFYFLEKYLEKFFRLPALPSNEKNSSNHHNSYNKGPNLVFFSFTESPSNSLLTIKFPKNHITSSYHRNLPKTAMTKIWPLKSFRG